MHPVFAKFHAFKGPVPAAHNYDYLGSLIDCKFDQTTPYPALYANAALPPSDHEEYFEWISLLRSVDEARGPFTFVECGAGYGRWAICAALAARQRDLPIDVIMVEAEPVHARWCAEHARNNGVTNFQVLEGAIGGKAGKQIFLVYNPSGEVPPNLWYGQAFDWEIAGSQIKTGEVYEGRPLVKNLGGWRGIEVEVFTLDQVLAKCDFVDLVDMDIQGAEADVVEADRDVLATKVRRIHIGTHSADVEQRIRSVMTALGWRCEFDFPCQSDTQTEYGKVRFDDGVQAWLNPAL